MSVGHSKLAFISLIMLMYVACMTCIVINFCALYNTYPQSVNPTLSQELPPYNGFGSLEDSKQSCLSLIPQPPKKDFIKMLENDGKILRFAAIMVR